MIKYTQSPWQVFWKKLDTRLMGKEFPIQQSIAVISTDDGLKIAEIYDTALPDMNEANARLVVAAPEMLYALEAALELLESRDLGMWGTVPLIRNTIAKAKGEPKNVE